MKKGFTLVELSIVLVIIGLLIGGILVGQSLIESARINGAINQVSQYDIAVSLFKDKFKCIPADCNKGIIFDGDGDGLIEDISDDNNSFTDEIEHFWPVLSTLKFINDGNIYIPVPPPGEGIFPGVNVPKIDIGAEGTSVAAFHQDGPYITSTTNVFHIRKFSDSHHGLEGVSDIKSLTVTEAYSFDKKVDDGIPREGNVGFFKPYQDCLVSSGGVKYNFDSSVEYPCTLEVKFGTFSGNN